VADVVPDDDVPDDEVPDDEAPEADVVVVVVDDWVAPFEAEVVAELMAGCTARVPMIPVKANAASPVVTRRARAAG
jgi:hypothetical protein